MDLPQNANISRPAAPLPDGKNAGITGEKKTVNSWWNARKPPAAMPFITCPSAYNLQNMSIQSILITPANYSKTQ